MFYIRIFYLTMTNDMIDKISEYENAAVYLMLRYEILIGLSVNMIGSGRIKKRVINLSGWTGMYGFLYKK